MNGYTGDLRTLFEIENQVHCYNYLKLLIVEKKALDINFIKRMQYKLMKVHMMIFVTMINRNVRVNSKYMIM